MFLALRCYSQHLLNSEALSLQKLRLRCFSSCPRASCCYSRLRQVHHPRRTAHNLLSRRTAVFQRTRRHSCGSAVCRGDTILARVPRVAQRRHRSARAHELPPPRRARLGGDDETSRKSVKHALGRRSVENTSTVSRARVRGHGYMTEPPSRQYEAYKANGWPNQVAEYDPHGVAAGGMYADCDGRRSRDWFRPNPWSEPGREAFGLRYGRHGRQHPRRLRRARRRAAITTTTRLWMGTGG